MPQHSTQLNDFTASASMDAFFGRAPSWKAPVPFDVHPRSENQLTEGRLAGLLQNPGSTIAKRELLTGLGSYYTHGHQAKEFGTASHSPHWYRIGAVGLWWAAEQVAGGHHEHEDVLAAMLRWWDCDQWVRDQYRATHGPLAGRVIGWGARAETDKRGELASPQLANMVENDTRDVVDALLAGRATGKSKKFFDNAHTSADTFPALVIQSLITRHSDILARIRAERPIIAYDLTITKTSESLSCECKNPDGKSPHKVDVDYAAGKVTLA